jgi:hypothetical protein
MPIPSGGAVLARDPPHAVREAPAAWLTARRACSTVRISLPASARQRLDDASRDPCGQRPFAGARDL